MNSAQGIRMKKPAHPGGFVRHEIIEVLDLSVTAAARVLGVTRAALSAVLNERARLSPEMALRIEKAFGVSMDTLMRMQNSYDIALARAGRRDRGCSVREKRTGQQASASSRCRELTPGPSGMRVQGRHIPATDVPACRGTRL